MRDARTVKLAYRPVSADALAKFLRLRRLEAVGKPSWEAIQQAGLPADEVSRIGAAVNTFCRPRLLRIRLAQAAPKSAERRLKQQQKLAEAIDDSDFLELYGQATWDLMCAQEEVLVALREKSESLISPG